VDEAAPLAAGSRCFCSLEVLGPFSGSAFSERLVVDVLGAVDSVVSGDFLPLNKKKTTATTNAMTI
jgi:hypothetical protein